MINIKATETDRCYTQLHDAIVGGELLPNQRLVEMELAQQFGVGRAAVREALARLEQDGLVEREPNRGARVRAILQAEAAEMLEVRAVLEGLAARHAARNATDEEITALQTLQAAMQRCFEQGDLLGISNLNAQLHNKLLSIANHKTVSSLIQRLRAQQVRFQHRTILVPGRARQSLAEHGAIIETVARHDEDGAEAAMRHHLGNVIDALHRSDRKML